MIIERLKFPWKEESREEIEKAMRTPGRDAVPTHPHPKEKLHALLRDERRAEAREQGDEAVQVLRARAIEEALQQARKENAKDQGFLITLNQLLRKHAAGELDLRTEQGMVLKAMEELKRSSTDEMDRQVRNEAVIILQKKLDILSHLISISNRGQKI